MKILFVCLIALSAISTVQAGPPDGYKEFKRIILALITQNEATPLRELLNNDKYKEFLLSIPTDSEFRSDVAAEISKTGKVSIFLVIEEHIEFGISRDNHPLILDNVVSKITTEEKVVTWLSKNIRIPMQYLFFPSDEQKIEKLRKKFLQSVKSGDKSYVNQHKNDDIMDSNTYDKAFLSAGEYEVDGMISILFNLRKISARGMNQFLDESYVYLLNDKQILKLYKSNLVNLENLRMRLINGSPESYVTLMKLIDKNGNQAVTDFDAAIKAGIDSKKIAIAFYKSNQIESRKITLAMKSAFLEGNFESLHYWFDSENADPNVTKILEFLMPPYYGEPTEEEKKYVNRGWATLHNISSDEIEQIKKLFSTYPTISEKEFTNVVTKTSPSLAKEYAKYLYDIFVKPHKASSQSDYFQGQTRRDLKNLLAKFGVVNSSEDEVYTRSHPMYWNLSRPISSVDLSNALSDMVHMWDSDNFDYTRALFIQLKNHPLLTKESLTKFYKLAFDEQKFGILLELRNENRLDFGSRDFAELFVNLIKSPIIYNFIAGKKFLDTPGEKVSRTEIKDLDHLMEKRLAYKQYLVTQNRGWENGGGGWNSESREPWNVNLDPGNILPDYIPPFGFFKGDERKSTGFSLFRSSTPWSLRDNGIVRKEEPLPEEGGRSTFFRPWESYGPTNVQLYSNGGGGRVVSMNQARDQKDILESIFTANLAKFELYVNRYGWTDDTVQKVFVVLLSRFELPLTQHLESFSVPSVAIMNQESEIHSAMLMYLLDAKFITKKELSHLVEKYMKSRMNPNPFNLTSLKDFDSEFEIELIKKRITYLSIDMLAIVKPFLESDVAANIEFISDAKSGRLNRTQRNIGNESIDEYTKKIALNEAIQAREVDVVREYANHYQNDADFMTYMHIKYALMIRKFEYWPNEFDRKTLEICKILAPQEYALYLPKYYDYVHERNWIKMPEFVKKLTSKYLAEDGQIKDSDLDVVFRQSSGNNNFDFYDQSQAEQNGPVRQSKRGGFPVIGNMLQPWNYDGDGSHPTALFSGGASSASQANDDADRNFPPFKRRSADPGLDVTSIYLQDESVTNYEILLRSRRTERDETILKYFTEQYGDLLPDLQTAIQKKQTAVIQQIVSSLPINRLELEFSRAILTGNSYYLEQLLQRNDINHYRVKYSILYLLTTSPKYFFGRDTYHERESNETLLPLVVAYLPEDERNKFMNSKMVLSLKDEKSVEEYGNDPSNEEYPSRNDIIFGNDYNNLIANAKGYIRNRISHQDYTPETANLFMSYYESLARAPLNAPKTYLGYLFTGLMEYAVKSGTFVRELNKNADKYPNLINDLFEVPGSIMNRDESVRDEVHQLFGKNKNIMENLLDKYSTFPDTIKKLANIAKILKDNGKQETLGKYFPSSIDSKQNVTGTTDIAGISMPESWKEQIQKWIGPTWAGRLGVRPSATTNVNNKEVSQFVASFVFPKYKTPSYDQRINPAPSHESIVDYFGRFLNYRLELYRSKDVEFFTQVLQRIPNDAVPLLRSELTAVALNENIQYEALQLVVNDPRSQPDEPVRDRHSLFIAALMGDKRVFDIYLPVSNPNAQSGRQHLTALQVLIDDNNSVAKMHLSLVNDFTHPYDNDYPLSQKVALQNRINQNLAAMLNNIFADSRTNDEVKVQVLQYRGNPEIRASYNKTTQRFEIASNENQASQPSSNNDVNAEFRNRQQAEENGVLVRRPGTGIVVSVPDFMSGKQNEGSASQVNNKSATANQSKGNTTNNVVSIKKSNVVIPQKKFVIATKSALQTIYDQVVTANKILPNDWLLKLQEDLSEKDHITAEEMVQLAEISRGKMVTIGEGKILAQDVMNGLSMYRVNASNSQMNQLIGKLPKGYVYASQTPGEPAVHGIKVENNQVTISSYEIAKIMQASMGNTSLTLVNQGIIKLTETKEDKTIRLQQVKTEKDIKERKDTDTKEIRVER